MELIILLSLVTFLLIYFLKRRGNTSPPGPKRIPFLGSLPFLPTKKGITDWVLEDAVTRHKITRVDFGPNPAYFINDFDLAKELFDKAEFSGRNASPLQLVHRYFNKTPQGILFTQDEQWSTHRRFSLKTLKDFGFGKKSIEESIHFEIEELSETFLSAKGDNCIGTDFNVPIINILWQMVADSRFTPEDPAGMKMVENVSTIFATGIKYDQVPLFLNKMFKNWTGFGERVKAHESILYYLMKIVEKHEADLDLENPKDFIDVYLIEMKKQSGGQEYNKQDPSRFINSDGRYMKHERVIPFGIGKRYCMGELLARNEIFLFMVTMLQKIQFKLPKHHPRPDTQNYICNLTRIPDDFYVYMERI